MAADGAVVRQGHDVGDLHSRVQPGHEEHDSPFLLVPYLKRDFISFLNQSRILNTNRIQHSTTEVVLIISCTGCHSVFRLILGLL